VTGRARKPYKPSNTSTSPEGEKPNRNSARRAGSRPSVLDEAALGLRAAGHATGPDMPGAAAATLGVD
jgi:hypothetical protein